MKITAVDVYSVKQFTYVKITTEDGLYGLGGFGFGGRLGSRLRRRGRLWSGRYCGYVFESLVPTLFQGAQFPAPVACFSQYVFGPVNHASDDGLIANEAPPVVFFFRPRIGKKGIDPAKRSLGQTGQELPRVIVKNADVGYPFAFDQAQQAGYAVIKRLAADKPDVGTGPGLGRQVFPGAETDLEPDFGNRALESAFEVEGCARGWELQAQPGQQGLDQRLAAGTQFVAAAPAVPAKRFVTDIGAQVAPKADFRSSTRSMLSHEKPPSASGARPKWP